MSSILLIHGAWHWGGVWNRVKPLLEAAGHDVHAPTLVGMGETAGVYEHHPYSHLGIRDHIRQIERYITLNDLQTPYLVGHSYGGAVTNGVLNQLGTKVAGALFLDAIFFVPGRRYADLVQIPNPPPWLRPWYRTVLRNVLLNRPVPPPPVEFMGLDDPADAQIVAQRMTVVPSRLRDGRFTIPPPQHPHLTYLRCTGGAQIMQAAMAPYAEYARSQGWAYSELASGHDAMLSSPRAVAEQILASIDVASEVAV